MEQRPHRELDWTQPTRDIAHHTSHLREERAEPLESSSGEPDP